MSRRRCDIAGTLGMTVMEPLTFRELCEIHDITGGRPYEIQLLCHFMFKRLQSGAGSRMRLSLAVLDDVLGELGRGKDIYSRPVISAVRALNNANRDQDAD